MKYFLTILCNILLFHNSIEATLACSFAYKEAKEKGYEFIELFLSPFCIELMKGGIEYEKYIKEAFSWEKNQI